jgi:hypothetical protein
VYVRGYAGLVTDTPTRTNAPTLRWAVRVLAVEAVALTGLAIYVAWATLARSTTSKQGAGALLALIVIGVLIVAGLSRALSNLKTWARGPAIVLELLLLPIGYTMISGGLAYVGIPVMLVGIVGAGLLLAPATRTALGLDRYGSH